MLEGSVEIIRLIGPRFVVSFAPYGVDGGSPRGSRTCSDIAALRDVLTPLGIEDDLQTMALRQLEAGVRASIPNVRVERILLARLGL